MSRCFPFPPPGYSGNDALIESIKLQREREKAKTERKKEKREKKREKKEKRKEKKEKKEKKLNLVATPLDENCPKIEKSFRYLEGEHKGKIAVDSSVDLTRSGVTEEHGQPINSSNPSYSSDSTQNSNKRKRSALPITTTSIAPQTNGNTFRIRLPMQKHKEPVASSSKDEPCSTSGRTIIHAQHKHGDAKEAIKYRDVCSPPSVKDSIAKKLIAGPPSVKDSIAKKLIARPELKNPVGKAETFLHDTTPTPARTDNPVNRTIAKAKVPLQEKTSTTIRANSSATTGKAQISESKETSNRITEKATILVQDKRLPSGESSHDKKLKRASKQYTELFRSWVPPPLEVALPGSDDEEWLFGGKRQKREEEEKRIQGSDDVSCCASFALQPVARFLPETNIFAMPYTVPF